MIDDVAKIFAMLDEELNGSEDHYEIIISGGAVMTLHVNSRRTHDVDVVHGSLTEELLSASSRVAIKLKLRPNWLNNAASSFNQTFELGWKDRSYPIFKGKYLIVKAIANQDLIRAKYISFLSRGFDLEDLINLKPAREEIIRIMTYALSSNVTGRNGFDIILDTDELLEKLNYGPITESERKLSH